jgi:hypothetical protein
MVSLLTLVPTLNQIREPMATFLISQPYLCWVNTNSTAEDDAVRLWIFLRLIEISLPSNIEIENTVPRLHLGREL